MKKVQDIKKDDLVMTPNGKSAKVLCNVKIEKSRGMA